MSGPVTVDEPEVTTVADDGGSLAWWVPIGILALLAAGGGAAWLIRRRGTT